MTFAATKEQDAIFAHMLGGEGSLIVSATAGSGKTTTLIQTVTRMIDAGHKPGTMLFVAFNKAIIDELKGRLPRGVFAATMHSLGNTILRENLGKGVRLEQYKHSNMLRDFLKAEGVAPYRHPRYAEISAACKALLERVRVWLLDPDGDLEAALVATEMPFRATDAPLIVRTVRDALKEGRRMAVETGAIDFTDMLYLPWALGLQPAQRYPTVFVDELQDQSELQRWLVLQSMAEGGRLLGVGDPRQSIYGWAGAVKGNMDILQRELNAATLPLSVTWRCPQRHVFIAQVIADTDIQPAPGAAVGTVAHYRSLEAFEAEAEEGDLVLCRNNAPLIQQAFRFLAMRRRIKIRGRDIGEGLIRTLEHVAQAVPVYSRAGMINAAHDWARERERVVLARKDLAEEELAGELQELHDLQRTLVLILEGSAARNLNELTAEIRGLFEDTGGGDFILLSTVHKAKGLEAERCFILSPELMPAPYGDPIEEECILFVALTRAKQHLGFVGGLPGGEDLDLEEAILAVAR